MVQDLFHPTPAVGFEQPFEMLEACHERVQRSLGLLARLVEHVDRAGHDEQSRAAARDVLRYFELAAPLHHEDEERHVFPRLLAGGDAALRATVARLRDDHERMGVLWRGLRGTLEAWTRPDSAGAVEPALRAQARAFAALYAEHIPIEEGLAFPAARAGLDAPGLVHMGEEMQARRRVG